MDGKNFQYINIGDLFQQQQYMQQINAQKQRKLSQQFMEDAVKSLQKLISEQQEYMYSGMTLDKIQQTIQHHTNKISDSELNKMQIRVIQNLISCSKPYVYYRNEKNIIPTTNTVIIVINYEIIKQITSNNDINSCYSLIKEYFNLTGYKAINFVVLIYASENDLDEINATNSSGSVSSMLNQKHQKRYQNIKYNNIFFVRKESNIFDVLLPIQYLYSANTFIICDTNTFSTQQLKDTIHYLNQYLDRKYALFLFKYAIGEVSNMIKNIFSLFYNQIQTDLVQKQISVKEQTKIYEDKLQELLQAKQLYPFTQYKFSLAIDLFW